MRNDDNVSRSHTSVLKDETIEALQIVPGGVYVDATLGGGGHASEICKRIGPEGVLIGIDQDPFALSYAESRLSPYECEKIFIRDNFSNLDKILRGLGVERIDGIVYDLGVSSFQLDEGERGFSYHSDGPLDMRMDSDADFSAYDVVNTYSEEELTRVLKEYGEERFAKRIARRIVSEREKKPIETTGELTEIVTRAYPKNARYKKKHPARKTFQALRIEVNKELTILEPALEQAIEYLAPGGRIAVISFHSLEDRIVKHFFKAKENPCTCPPELPRCVCGKKPEVKIITRKPVVADEKEVEENSRARSAKLRVAEKA